MKIGQRCTASFIAMATALAISGTASAAEDGAAAAEQAADQAAPAEGQGIQDIVVTAQRRSESVQRASLSIEALNSDTLVSRGVTDALAMNDVVPGLKIAYTGGQLQVFVRGVGDVSANAYTQSSVSLNVDGIYVARSSAFSADFYDTARIEVLRGPQGTLYGRNSSGGAINVISRAPVLGESEGYVAAEAGNYDLYRGQFGVNVPMGDTFAVRIAGQLTRRDGYTSDGGSDDRSEGIRVRALWEPNEDLSIALASSLAHIGGNGPVRVYRPALFGDPWTGPQDPRITSALFPALRVRNDNSIDTDSFTFSGEVNWNLGGVKLTVIPAYRYMKTRSNIGIDLIFDETDNSKQYSLEGRLSGESSLLKWVVGAYGFKENLSVFVRNDQRQASPLTGQLQFQDIPKFDTSAWAMFGEATLSVSDAFRLVGGLRYTEESRTRTGTINNQNFTAGAMTTSSTLVLGGDTKVSAVTWRGGMEFDVAPGSMAYATVSRGFKSGGFDATGNDAYNPEYVTAYTVGIKNRLLDNTLQINAEGFYWKYKDQQIAFLGQDSTGATTFVTRNAGQSTIKGANLDIVWQPTDNDTFDFGVEFLDTNYTDFRYNTFGAFAAGTVLSDGCISDGPVVGKPGQFTENCSGNVLPRAPKWSGNARYAHEFDLGNGGSITAAGVFKFQSLQYLALNYVSPFYRQTSFQTYDADLTYNAPDKRWSLQLYIRNISNKAVYMTASNQSSIAPTTGVNRGSVDAIGAPRTFGARLQYNF